MLDAGSALTEGVHGEPIGLTRWSRQDAVDVEPPVTVDCVLGQQPADEHEQRHVEQVYQVVRCGDRDEVGKVPSDGQQEMPDCDKND